MRISPKTVVLIFLCLLVCPFEYAFNRDWYSLPNALAGPFGMETLAPSQPPAWWPDRLGSTEGRPENWVRNNCKKYESGPALNERCEWLANMAKSAYKPARGRAFAYTWILDRGSWENARAVNMHHEQVYMQALETDAYAHFGDNIKEVGLIIEPPGRSKNLLHLKMCEYVTFKVRAYWVIENNTYYLDIRPSAVKWWFSDAKALIPYEQELRRVSISGETFSTYMANKQGTYTLIVSAPSIKPSDFVEDRPGDFMLRHKFLSDRLINARAEIKITIDQPHVKNITISPASVTLKSGESCMFDAVATFKESCVPPLKHSEDPTRITWSSQRGNIQGNFYVAGKTDPGSLKIFCTSHSKVGKVRPCDFVRFEALLNFARAVDKVTANLEGVSGSATVTIEPPGDALNVTYDPGTKWSDGGPAFQITKVQPYRVTVKHEPSNLTDAMTLEVADPSVDRIEIQPPSKTLSVGEETKFKALAFFKETCLAPKEVSVTWKPEGKVGSVFSFKAKKPGEKFTLVAAYHDPKTNRVVKGSAQVTVHWPKLVIEPKERRALLDQRVDFKALWQGDYIYNMAAQDVEWKPGSSITGQRCGEIMVQAYHRKSGQIATARVIIEVDCIEVRKRLADLRSRKTDPNHVKENVRWLESRLNLLQKRGCDCGVPIGWQNEFRSARGDTPYKQGQKIVQNFPNPTIKGSGPLDACLRWDQTATSRWGVDCGLPTATRFCKDKGFDKAIGYDPGEANKTYLYSGQTCEAGKNFRSCGTFTNIKCEKTIGKP